MCAIGMCAYAPRRLMSRHGAWPRKFPASIIRGAVTECTQTRQRTTQTLFFRTLRCSDRRSMSSRQFALLLASGLCSAFGASSELYTTNAICRQNSCVNPVFPGLNDMPRLEQIDWQCSSLSAMKDHMKFCADAIVYDPALPSPNQSNTAVQALVESQDAAAVTMYFYHLQALGYEAQEHESPSSDPDHCVRSIWEMVCYTYFPRSEAGCTTGQASLYLRPCKGSCSNYLSNCNVECCDESASCVFTHTEDVDGVAMTSTGYVDAVAPSSLCTGIQNSARRGLGNAPLLLFFGLFGIQVSAGALDAGPLVPGRRTAMGVSLLAMAFFLQGCTFDVPHHETGNWRAKDDYLVEYEFIPPGETEATATLNSCSVAGLTASQQCSGKGYCKAWDNEQGGALSFCQCDRDWADPECRTKRKSQATAFLYSLFLGFLGADYFYLGYSMWGLAKLLTLGGLGFWWLLDIVRIGSGPVYAASFRTAADLPHWAFVVCTLAIFMLLGFVWGISSYLSYRKKKRADVMKLQEAEEFRQVSNANEYGGLHFRGPGRGDFDGPRGFSGYGATLPVPLPNAGAPYAVPPAQGEEGRFAGPYGPAGVPGAGFPQ